MKKAIKLFLVFLGILIGIAILQQPIFSKIIDGSNSFGLTICDDDSDCSLCQECKPDVCLWPFCSEKTCQTTCTPGQVIKICVFSSNRNQWAIYESQNPACLATTEDHYCGYINNRLEWCPVGASCSNGRCVPLSTTTSSISSECCCSNNVNCIGAESVQQLSSTSCTNTCLIVGYSRSCSSSYCESSSAARTPVSCSGDSSCPSDYPKCCNSKCVNILTDRENCGRCGNECEGDIDGGCYCNQGKCSNTPPYEGAPGCPSQGSRTTVLGQTATTISGSNTIVSTTTSTSTTTTSIIPASLACEKNEINVGEINNCTVSNCDIGMWIVANKEGQPLSLNQIIITDLPPNQIQIGPTVGPGSIVTLAFCMSPAAASLKHETIVSGVSITEDNFKIELRGDYDQTYENSTIYIEDDKIGDACSTGCSLCDWSQGLTRNIDTEDYCADNELEVRFLDSENVNSDCNAKHRACIYEDGRWKCCERQCGSNGCENSVTFDCDTWQCIEPKEFEIGTIDCNEDTCTLDIESNTLNQQLDIYIYLIKEPSGKIYYSGSDTISSDFEGLKDISMDRTTICPSGTELNVVINVYDEDLDRVYNIKGEGFECRKKYS